MLPLLLMLSAATPGQAPDKPAAKPTRVLLIPPFAESQPLHAPRAVPAPTSLAECLLACPSPNDSAPFLRLPKVTAVEECRNIASAECDERKTWSQTFHAAAKFTIPRFGLSQEPLEGDAMVIYEGMKLTVNPATGVFDLTFTATVPPTPVVVRLQLTCSHDTFQQPIRLTLPPIRIDTDTSANSGDTAGRTIRVQHRGHSELLMDTPDAIRNASNDTKDLQLPIYLKPGARCAFPICKENNWVIGRVGSAKFGSGRINSDEPDR